MKSQLNLVQLATEITRQSTDKRDFLCHTKEMHIHFEEGRGILELGRGGEGFELTPGAHQQLSTRLKVPGRYYDRLLFDHPDLLEHQVNALLHREPEMRLVRTLDGKARALLSDSYKRLDHDALLEAVLPRLSEAQIDLDASVFYLEEERLEMKLVLPRTRGEVRKGDVVTHALHITNSEVGASRLRITPMLYRLVCTNGMIAPESLSQDRVDRVHLGSRLRGLDLVLGSAALHAQDKDLWASVSASARRVIEGTDFESMLDLMRDTTTREIPQPPKAVSRLARHHGLRKEEAQGVLAHFMAGRDLTAYGLLNAVTRTAQDVPGTHRSSELEAIGGRLLEMSARSWNQLVAA